jgi:hypothetical protein
MICDEEKYNMYKTLPTHRTQFLLLREFQSNRKNNLLLLEDRYVLCLYRSNSIHVESITKTREDCLLKMGFLFLERRMVDNLHSL